MDERTPEQDKTRCFGEELLQREGLDSRTRILVVLFLALCRKDRASFELGLERAGAEGISTDTLRELCLQGTLFAGFPRAMDAYECLTRVVGKSENRHVDTERSFAELRMRGEGLFERIYGEHRDRVIERLEGLDPAFAEFVLGFAYGQVLCRPGLSLEERELLAVGALFLGAEEKQLLSHARGALRAGASAAEILWVADTVLHLKSTEELNALRRRLESFLAERSAP